MKNGGDRRGPRRRQINGGDLEKLRRRYFLCFFFTPEFIMFHFFSVRGIDGKFLRGVDILWGKWGRGGGELESAAADWNRKDPLNRKKEEENNRQWNTHKRRREIVVGLSYAPIFLYPFMAVVVVGPDLAYKKILPPSAFVPPKGL